MKKFNQIVELDISTQVRSWWLHELRLKIEVIYLKCKIKKYIADNRAAYSFILRNAFGFGIWSLWSDKKNPYFSTRFFEIWIHKKFYFISVKDSISFLAFFLNCFSYLSISCILSLSLRRFRSYRNQSIDLLCKSVNCSLHDRDLRHKAVKVAFSMVFENAIWYFVSSFVMKLIQFAIS